MIANTQRAIDMGYHAVLLALPVHTKPKQAAIISHFNTVIDPTGVNIVRYSYPGMDGVKIEHEALDVLARNPRIIGIKESFGILQRAIGISARYARRFNWSGVPTVGSAARPTAWPNRSAKWAPPSTRVVICAGAFLVRLVKGLGEPIPLETERGHHTRIMAPGISMKHPISWPARAFIVSSTVGGIRVGSTVELAGLDAAAVMFRSMGADGTLRTCAILRPDRADCSPCWTGSNSNMASRHARGPVRSGDVMISRSIIGGAFRTEFVAETMVDPRVASRNRVSGQCWIYGISQIGLGPTDPFQAGLTLSASRGGQGNKHHLAQKQENPAIIAIAGFFWW